MFQDRPLENGFALGLFRPGDAPGMVECYREAYGDGFPMRYVYDPRAIIEKNSQGELFTLVVRTPEGRVAGCAGLFPANRAEMIYEAGQLIVRKEFRGTHLGRSLRVACLEELPPCVGVRVLQLEAVCTSPVSQEMAVPAGLVPTGLELGVLPGPDGTRISLLCMTKVIEDRPHTVFAPDAYVDFVRASCGRLGIERDIGAGVPPVEESCTVEVERMDFAGLLRCRVRRVGRDFAARLDDLLEADGESIVQVQVDLSRESAPWAVALLEEKGFSLGGHFPLGLGGDALMLQRLPFAPDEASIKVMAGAADVLASVLADRRRIGRGRSA